MSVRDNLIDLICEYGKACSELAEARNMTQAALLTVSLMKANLEIVNFVDKHYEVKGKYK